MGVMRCSSLIIAMAASLLTACAGGTGGANSGGGIIAPIAPASIQSVYVNLRPTSTTNAVNVYGPAGIGSPPLERSIATQGGVHMNSLSVAVDSAGYIYAGIV